MPFSASGASPCAGVAPRQLATYPPRAHARCSAISGSSPRINNELIKDARNESPAPTVSQSLLLFGEEYPGFSSKVDVAEVETVLSAH